MADETPVTGKRRTRAHVIAALSSNHLERVILESGHIFIRWEADYGYDVSMKTFDEQGVIEPGIAYFQLKASDQFPESGDAISFDLEVRDYLLWMRERYPVILCLFDAPRRRMFYLDIKDHFRDESSRPAADARTIRVPVPRRQRLDRWAIRRIRLQANHTAEQPNLRILR